MELENISILSSDGLELNVWKWEVENPKRVLCIVHGLGEHGGRYGGIVKNATESGISVFALDQRGHGKSQGKKGHTPSINQSISDVEELLKTARSFHTDAPMLLFGHSMGGNIVANYMHSMNTNEISGFILSAPWLQLCSPPAKWKIKLGKLIHAIWPSFQQRNKLNPQLLSHDPIIIENYLTDPLVHNRMTPGLYFEMTNSGADAIEKASKIKTKGLVYHGSEDALTDKEGSKKFVNNASDLIEYWEIEGAYHEPHNDTGKEKVFSRIMEWVLKIEPKEIK